MSKEIIRVNFGICEISKLKKLSVETLRAFYFSNLIHYIVKFNSYILMIIILIILKLFIVYFLIRSFLPV